MKFLRLAYPLLVILAVASVYIFIPSDIRLARKVVIDCNVAAANRYLQNPSNWKYWWPGKESGSSAPYGSFEFSDAEYSIQKIVYNGLNLLATQQVAALGGSVHTIAYSKDTTIIQFEFRQKTSLNPLTRFRQYSAAKNISAGLATIAKSLHDFLHDKEKVYGIKLQRVLNGERALIVQDSYFDHRPGQTEVDQYLSKLRNEMKKMGASEISYPMLHISTQNGKRYFMMVAVQTNIKLELEGKTYYKHTYPGYVLVTQVTGGPGKVDDVISKMHTYIQDYEIVSPAIPYAEMVTDRRKETDTSTWVSRVYYPVF